MSFLLAKSYVDSLIVVDSRLSLLPTTTTHKM